MEDVIIKIGLLSAWKPDRGFGFIHVPTEVFPLQKYFIHAADILEGANPPPIGSVVRFEVGPTKGRYPAAKKAWIVAQENISAKPAPASASSEVL